MNTSTTLEIDIPEVGNLGAYTSESVWYYKYCMQDVVCTHAVGKHLDLR